MSEYDEISEKNKATFLQSQEVVKDYTIPVRSAIPTKAKRYSKTQYWLHFTPERDKRLISFTKPEYHTKLYAVVDQFLEALKPEVGFNKTSMNTTLECLGLAISTSDLHSYAETYPLTSEYTAILDVFFQYRDPAK